VRQSLLSVGYACAAYSSRDLSHEALVQPRVHLDLSGHISLTAERGGTLEIQTLGILPDKDWVLLCLLGLGKLLAIGFLRSLFSKKEQALFVYV
jgi:hypothetical protein